jgi:hypothetical protein
VLNVRFEGRWPAGVHLAYTAAAAAGVGLLGVPLRRAPRTGPRAWETTLLLVAWLLSAMALVRVVDVLATDPGAGAVWVVLGVLAVLGAAIALRGVATGTTLAAIAGGASVLAFAAWAGDPSLQADRWLLFAELALFVLLVLAHRDRRPHHAAQLANAAALAALAIVATGVVESVQNPSISERDGFLLGLTPSLGWGWELLLLAAGFGAIAYGAVDRHRGPVLLGAVVLLGFVGTTMRGDLVGWPLMLAAIAAATLVIGLRPTRPLPPPPEDDGDAVEPLPLR